MSQPMTPDEFAARMKAIDNEGDWESDHEDADALMCEILRSLGYAEGVAAFEAMDKWYG